MKKNLLLGLLLATGISVSAQTAGDETSLANGTVVPDFTATDLNGIEHSLYENYLNNGKSVVIDFSATWCAPCWSYHQTHAMADFYEAYGPAGSNEAMVIFVEGDIVNTNTNNLYGEQGPVISRGNWTIGSPYPIIEDTESMNLGAANKYDVDYFPTMYVLCQGTKTSLKADQKSALQLRNIMNQCQTLVGIPNHGRINQSTTALRVCENGEAANIQAKLKNFGNNAINTATVVIKENGTVISTKNYTGTLNQFATAANVNFENIILNNANTYTIELLDINGVAQTNPELNSVPVSFSFADAAETNVIEVRVYTDYYPAENGWEIRNSENTVVASGGPYQAGPQQYGGGGPDANVMKSYNVTLPGTTAECFTVYLEDVGDYNDGWAAVPQGAPAPGIEIYSNGELVYQNVNVGSFGASLTVNNAFRTWTTLGNKDIIANTFAMYPNPTTGLLNFNTQEPVDITVLDLTGKVVFTAKGIENGGSVNLGFLQSGMYVAKINGPATERIEKIVIE